MFVITPKKTQFQTNAPSDLSEVSNIVGADPYVGGCIEKCKCFLFS